MSFAKRRIFEERDREDKQCKSYDDHISDEMFEKKCRKND